MSPRWAISPASRFRMPAAGVLAGGGRSGAAAASTGVKPTRGLLRPPDSHTVLAALSSSSAIHAFIYNADQFSNLFTLSCDPL